MGEIKDIGGRAWYKRIYNRLPFTNSDFINAFFKGDVHIAGELFAQGFSILFERALALGGVGIYAVITNLVDGIQSFIVTAKVQSGLSQNPDYVDRYKTFIKSDPLGQGQPDDSETFTTTQFTDSITGEVKYYFRMALPSISQVATDNWYLRSLTGFVNTYIKVYNGYELDVNATENLYWKTNTEKQIKEKTGLVNNVGGAGIDIEFKLGDSHIEKQGDIFTYFVISDNEFTIQGATFPFTPPDSDKIVYVVADGAQWRERPVDVSARGLADEEARDLFYPEPRDRESYFNERLRLIETFYAEFGLWLNENLIVVQNTVGIDVNRIVWSDDDNVIGSVQYIDVDYPTNNTERGLIYGVLIQNGTDDFASLSVRGVWYVEQGENINQHEFVRAKVSGSNADVGKLQGRSGTSNGDLGRAIEDSGATAGKADRTKVLINIQHR